MTTAAPATNSTASVLYHGWMSAPDVRGTTDIIWSCLSTIFLCVWTAIHPPLAYYPRDKPMFSDNRRKWLRQKIIESKIIPALISLIAPELMTYVAIEEFFKARTTMRKLNLASNGLFSTMHGFFLNMGGFCLRSPEGVFHQLDYDVFVDSGNESEATSDPEHASVSRESSVPSLAESSIYGLDNINELGDVGLGNQFDSNSDLNDDDPTRETLVASHIEVWIHGLEKSTGDEIHALSKSDSLTKMVACFQALWFVTQVISRVVERRAVTLLEVSTCAYVFSACIAYVAWWQKPQSCSMPLMIDCSNDVIARLPESGYEYCEGTWEEYVWSGTRSPVFLSNIPNLRQAAQLYVLLLIFGSIHVAAWDVGLPSDLESTMWRSSTLICCGVSLVGFVLDVFVRDVPDNFWDTWFRLLYRIPGNTAIIVYITARLFMIVEVFISMRALPRSAYDTVNWSAYIPHI